MISPMETATFDLVTGIAEAVDLINPIVANHHKKVAYFATALALEGGLSEKEREEILIAGMLHDIGAISLQERKNLLFFQAERTVSHCEIGYRLLKMFPPFANIAEIVRYHHTPWRNGEGTYQSGYDIPLSSHLIHLADRIAVCIEPNEDILDQSNHILATIIKHKNTLFHPEHVEWFEALADKEFFWLEATVPNIDYYLRSHVSLSRYQLEVDDLVSLAQVFAHVIDFKSTFTATHSAGVSVVADKLAQLLRFQEEDRKLIQVAGYLHDIGKLAVPTEILEKPGMLDPSEINKMRRHTFYTNYILDHIKGFQTVKTYAALHHEHMNGKGYPFHLKAEDLPLGTRILAVADVFTALTEDRPYRTGMAKTETMKIVGSMVDSYKLDPQVVLILSENYEDIDKIRVEAQDQARIVYKQLVEVDYE